MLHVNPIKVLISFHSALLVTAKKRLQFRIRMQKKMRQALHSRVEMLDEEIKAHGVS